jgi:hypothetical protein
MREKLIPARKTDVDGAAMLVALGQRIADVARWTIWSIRAQTQFRGAKAGIAQW